MLNAWLIIKYDFAKQIKIERKLRMTDIESISKSFVF